MIKHIVMYKLNNPTQESKMELVDRFKSMKGQIPCLLDIEAGVDLLKSDRSFDVALVCVFDSMEKLEEYKVDPFHQKIVEYVKSVVKQSCSVDYEV